jgi:hypothetical protein
MPEIIRKIKIGLRRMAIYSGCDEKTMKQMIGLRTNE